MIGKGERERDMEKREAKQRVVEDRDQKLSLVSGDGGPELSELNAANSCSLPLSLSLVRSLSFLSRWCLCLCLCLCFFFSFLRLAFGTKSTSETGLWRNERVCCLFCAYLLTAGLGHTRKGLRVVRKSTNVQGGRLGIGDADRLRNRQFLLVKEEQSLETPNLGRPCLVLVFYLGPSDDFDRGHRHAVLAEARAWNADFHVHLRHILDGDDGKEDESSRTKQNNRETAEVRTWCIGPGTISVSMADGGTSVTRW